MVANSLIGRGGQQSEWTWWSTVGLDVAFNSQIGLDGQQSD